MTKEQFKRETQYQATIHIARIMLKKDLITPDDFEKINTYLEEKYKPVFSFILAEKP
jgi:hypothetical protein